jgi:drug/metabolite transporter (DMT)-like permease
MAAWVALGIVAPVFYAGSNVYVAVARPPGVDSLALAAAMLLAAAAILAPIAAVSGDLYWPTRPLKAADFALLAHVGAASLGALLYFEIMRLAGAVFLSQVAYIVTLTGLLWGMYLFDERHSAWIWAALATILAGVALVTRRAAAAPPVSRSGG